jgi:hypothetical protein
MSPKRRSTDPHGADRPVPDALSDDRLTPRETGDDLTAAETTYWGDLLGFLLDQARSVPQPTPQPVAPAPQPRRPPALTPARRAALRHEVVVARHRWPAACDALLDAREVFDAGVAADGRSILVRCTAEVAAMLHPYATEEQP